MTSTETYFLGVDGGGSGCRAAIACADGTVVGTGTGGPANATTDAEGAVTNIMDAIGRAARDAGLSEDLWRSARAHLGIAGIMNDAQADDFATRLPMAATVTDDRPTSLIGAFGPVDGLLAAVGTGSTLGVARKGQMRFLGGWGLQVGDQASGAWLGRALLEQVLLSHDGLRTASPLIDAVFPTFDKDPNSIVAFAQAATPDAFAELAPQIVEAAEAGDQVGTELLARGAQYLEQALSALDPTDTMAICLTGGLGKSYENWLSETYAKRLIAPKGTALDGALHLARAAK